MKSDSGFGNVSRSILRPIIFKTAIETLCETKSFQSVTCISLENDISTARTLRIIDCTLTFYLEICELPRLFLAVQDSSIGDLVSQSVIK